MIYIATVHFINYVWIDIQLRYFQKYIKEPYRIYACIGGIEKDCSKNFYFISRKDGSHNEKLNYLAEKIIFDSDCNEDILIFIDSDAFPIADFVPFIKEKIKTNKLVAIRRDENNGDRCPHPSFCATSVGFWKKIRGDWSRGVWENKQGEEVEDIGGKLLHQLEDNNIDWYPLLKTDKAKLHPVFFGIYNNMIYHHVAGSRCPVCRNDMLAPKRMWKKNIEKARKLMSQVLDKIQNDEKFYLEFM